MRIYFPGSHRNKQGVMNSSAMLFQIGSHRRLNKLISPILFTAKIHSRISDADMLQADESGLQFSPDG